MLSRLAFDKRVPRLMLCAIIPRCFSGAASSASATRRFKPMEFLISNAYAQQGAPQGSLISGRWSSYSSLSFPADSTAAKKQKAHAELVAALQVGDEVMTAGGILGRITGVSDHYAVVQISETPRSRSRKPASRRRCPRAPSKKPD